jgi:hypothetical protein
MKDYLSEMEIPNRYAERMTSTSSGDMSWLDYHTKQLEYAPSIQEWVKVKCGHGIEASLDIAEQVGGRHQRNVLEAERS